MSTPCSSPAPAPRDGGTEASQRARGPRVRELLLACGLACVLTLVVSWRVVLHDEVILPADIVLQDAAWATVRPPGFTRATNGLISDQIRLFYVLHDLAARRLQSGGDVPLWNPYAFAGQPLVGNAQSALYSPPNLLLRWLPATTVANVRATFLVFAGALFAHAYARRIGVSPLGACVTMTAFVLGGPFVVWLGFPLANVLILLPLLLWTAEGLVAGRATLAWIAAGALGVGLAILGGHPETSFHVVALYAVYALARGWSAAGAAGVVRVGRGVVAAGLLGAAVGAVQLLPFLDALFASSTITARHEALSPSIFFDGAFWTELATLPTLLYPTFFGTPVAGNFDWPFAALSNYNRQTLYFGAVALALAAAAVAARRPRAPTRLLALLALACLAIAWHVPLLEAVNHLPVLAVVRNDRLRLPFAFFGATLAGLGCDAIRAHPVDRRARAAMAIVLGATVLVPPVVLLVAPHVPSSAPDWAHRLAGHLREEVFIRTQARSWAPLASAGLALCIVLGPIGARLPRRARGVLLLGLVGAELAVLAWNYNPSVPRTLVFPATRVTALLGGRQVPARVVGNGAFWANYGTPYGIAQVEAYDLPVPRSFVDLYRAQGGTGEDHHQRWQLDWPLIDMLGIEYAVSTVPLRQRGWIPVLRDGEVLVYRNSRAYPRAWIVQRAIVERDPAARLARLTAADFDARTTAVVEAEPRPADDGSASRTDEASEPGRASFVSYEPDRVELDVSTPVAGLLVTSEADAPGWKARVDDVPREVVRVNHAFRGVTVRAGRHRVVFTYDPWTSRAGRVASGIALAATVALGLIGWRRSRRVRAARR